jgi:hypothetical protein
VPLLLQHVPLLSETLRMLAINDLNAAAYPYAAGSQVRSAQCSVLRHRCSGPAFLAKSTDPQQFE